MEPKILKIKKFKGVWLVIIKDTNNNKIPFIIKFSNHKGKKYDVFTIEDNKIKFLLSFGASKYQHYYDLLKGYDELNHYNNKRRELYYKRHGSHHNNIYSAKFWSHVILWPLNINF